MLNFYYLCYVLYASKISVNLLAQRHQRNVDEIDPGLMFHQLSSGIFYASSFMPIPLAHSVEHRV